MDSAFLHRSLRFTARHRYHRTEWSMERNREVFGSNVEPHSHEWRLEVTVQGSIDPDTGWSIDLGVLDRLLDEEVVSRFDGTDLHREIPEVAEGGMQPSTEELARWFFRRLESRVPGGARLVRVRLWESPELGAEFSRSA